MSMAIPALSAAAIGSIPRLPGSLARIGADWEAPEDIRQETMGREALHLGSAMVLPALLGPVFTQVMPRLFKSSGFLASQMGATMMAALAGLTGAEVISRHFFPSEDWSEKADLLEDEFDDDEHFQLAARPMLENKPNLFKGSIIPAPILNPTSAASQMFKAPSPGSSFSLSV